MSARAARALRERVVETHDLVLRLNRDDVLRAVGPDPAAREEDPIAYAHGMLVHEGLRCTPPLASAQDDVELRLDNFWALSTAVAVLVPATAVAAAGLWVYGLTVLAAAAFVAWLLTRRWPTVARRAPAVVPRGRLLGLFAALAVLVIVGAAIVYPVREARRPDNLVVVLP